MEERQQSQDIVRDVQLPPEEALIDGRGIIMMIVMPALAHGQQSQQQTIAAGVGSFITPLSKHVAQRVNNEGAVI